MKWPRWPCWSINRGGRWTSSGSTGVVQRSGKRGARDRPHRIHIGAGPGGQGLRGHPGARRRDPGSPAGRAPRRDRLPFAGPSRGIEPRSRPDRNAASWCSPHRRVRGCATYTCAGKATRTAVTRSCSATTCGPTRLPDSSGGVQTTAGPQRAGPSGQRADQGPGHRDPDDRGRALGGGNGLAVASGEPRTARVPRDVSGLLQHPCRDREDQGGASAWFGARPVRRVRG